MDTSQENQEFFLNKDNFFLVERFILQNRIEVMNYLDNAPESEHRDIAADMLLQNMFLKKFQLDPGFRLQICVELENNPKIIQKCVRKILKLFLDTQFFSHDSISNDEEDEDYQFFKQNIQLDSTLLHQPYTYFFTSAFITSEKKEKWFYQLWKSFMESGKKLNATVTEVMLMELLTKNHFCYFLFQTVKYAKKTHPFLLAVNKISNHLVPMFLDYIEAQRKNLFVCEEIQLLIDNLEYSTIQSKIQELQDHLEALIKNKVDPIEQYIIHSQLLTICGIIYFNGLEFTEKIERLNQFYGIDHVTALISQNLDLYPLKQLLSELPIWAKFGLLSAIHPILHHYLSDNFCKDADQQSMKEDLATDLLILTKFICKSWLEQNNPTKAWNVLSQQYPHLTRWIQNLDSNPELYPENHLQLEILFLYGEIVSELEDSEKFSVCMSLFDQMLSKTSNKYLQTKIYVLESLLYRINCDFFDESDELENVPISLEDLRLDKDTNLFEIGFSLIPPQFLALQNKDPTKFARYMLEQGERIMFEREPLLPNRHEMYVMYAGSRKRILQPTIDPIFLSIQEAKVKYRSITSKSLYAQSMSSFRQALQFSKLIEKFRAWEDNPADLAIGMETKAFAHFYLEQYDSSKKLFEKALRYKPTEAYYHKYLVLINVLTQNLTEACDSLLNLYAIDNKTKREFLEIKGCYLLLMLWLGEAAFLNVIQEILKQNRINALNVEEKARIYCDIGRSIADLGYFTQAEEYLSQSLSLTQDILLKASIINNLGSIKSDWGDLSTAISYFNEAIQLDPNNPRFWMNLTKMYQMQSHFLEAKNVFEKAADHFHEKDADIADLMKLYSTIMDLYIKGSINFNLVHNPEAKKHLLQAKELIEQIHNLTSITENTNPIFLALANGFDCLFHDTISSILLTELSKRYPHGKWIPENEWKELPKGLQELWKGNHMAVGQIYYSITELLNPKTMLISQIKNCLVSLVTEEDLRTVQKFAYLVKEPRVLSGHGGIIDNEKYREILPALIEALNEALIVFAKIHRSLYP